MQKEIANWNNFPRRKVEFRYWKGKEQLLDSNNCIARGMGRSYGDASIADQVYSTLNRNAFLNFDEESGILECQAGVTLEDILESFVPRGWFLPVSPGTKYISIGGALAADVHGKNHHVDGSFGDHVISFNMIKPNGEKVICTVEDTPDIFGATRGGMGMTGMIESVKFRLKKIESSYIKQRQLKARNLSEIIELFDKHKSYTYSMAWIDCLKGGKNFGRSILIVGEHATKGQLSVKRQKDPLHTSEKKSKTMPFNFPEFVLNPLSIKAFNWLYYTKNIKPDFENIVHYDGFFYPLDSILHWNRMYGKRGFVQYQFVLPLESSEKGLKEIMGRIRKKGWGSFLAVLKLFGKQDSLISFPMEGFTLALDFPIRKGLLEFLDELDKVVLDLGGRIYLAKDARMKPEIFLNSYPNSSEFLQIIHKLNPEGRVKSDLAKRLLNF